MKIGDKVLVTITEGFPYKTTEKHGEVIKVYGDMCKVRIPLVHGGYRVVFGYQKDIKHIES